MKPEEPPMWKKLTKVLLAYTVMVLAICGAIFIVLVAYYIVHPSSSQGCDTAECFMEAANECQNATFTAQETIGTVKYSSEGCVFTKTLVKSSKDELPEVKALLEGKSLTCRYELGEFDRRWVTTLIYGINYCEGGLKEALGEMLLFVEPSPTAPAVT
ncbi:hypothetical protein JW898_02110 [Candidatus Woesearchaeota archaeon]|nr:hypothetical protein [Candidatus Woesearchaeota archaeon]